MIKPDLGTKRVCPSCAARFYDLQKRPIECPKCAYTFEPEVLLRQRRTRVPEPVVKAVVEAEDEETEAEDEEDAAEEEAEVEEVVAEVDEPVVATEDGEAEEGEVAPGMSVDEGEEPEEFEEEIEEDEDDDDLLEEVEEDEDDVTDIIDADLEKDEP